MEPLVPLSQFMDLARELLAARETMLAQQEEASRKLLAQKEESMRELLAQQKESSS